MAITNITEVLNALKDLTEALPTAVTVDDTLTKAGQVADAKAVGDALQGMAPAYSYGTTDLTAGSTPLETGKLYFVYE